jgi:hypothetical protein
LEDIKDNIALSLELEELDCESSLGDNGGLLRIQEVSLKRLKEIAIEEKSDIILMTILRDELAATEL